MKSGRIALVTGGAEGIGACTVQRLASKGYKVIFCDINQEKGKAREAAFKKDSLDATFFHCDVSSSESVRNLGELIRQSFNSISLIVSNAGIADPAMEFPSTDTGAWEKVIRTNLTASYYIVNALIDLMEPGSSIVLISSTRAIQSEPNTLAYSASKGGLLSLTHSLAITLSSRRVRSNCILPGWIDTSEWKIPPIPFSTDLLDNEQHPSGRVGRPEDIANLIVFLASKEGEWINGESIVVDGGITKKMIYFDQAVIDDANRLRNPPT